MQRQLDRIVAVLGEPGSAVLLLGRARSGKSQLAREIVESLERQPGAGRGTTVIPVPDPQSLHQFAARIDAAVQTAPMDADAPSPLLLLERVDLYDDAETVLLDRLRAAGRPGTGSGHRLRMLATAQSLLGGALAFSDSRTLQVTVAPLSLEEAEQQLITQLGGGQIDAATLQRWHAVSGGDHRALLLLLRANERSGTLRRRHGLAWVPAGEGVLPVEIVEEIEQECTEAERALLELIALAEPVAEPALLRLLDPALVGRLIADGRLRSSRLPDGRQALGLAIPLQGMVLRESMSPIRRMEYSARCFDALGATAVTLETPEELNR
ncbi:MAG: hypothetical protein J0H64_09775, partial [Actinobacteria bacterium]|nr:hypothetical protein [Actinomycetota bacterium]